MVAKVTQNQFRQKMAVGWLLMLAGFVVALALVELRVGGFHPVAWAFLMGVHVFVGALTILVVRILAGRGIVRFPS